MSRSSEFAAVRTPTICEVDALAVAMDLDRACKQFEADLEAGKQTRIEQYLGGVTRERTASFLQELLLIELGYLERQGKRANLEDYVARFPELELVIQSAFVTRKDQVRAKKDQEVNMLPGRSVGRYRQSAGPEGLSATPLRRLQISTAGLEAGGEAGGHGKQETVSNRRSSQTDTLIFSDSGHYLGSAPRAASEEASAGGSAFAEPRQALSTLFAITQCDPAAALGLEQDVDAMPLAEMLRLASSERHLQALRGLIRYRAKLHAAGLFVGFQWLSGYLGEQESERTLPVVTFFRLPPGLTQLSLVAKEPTAFPADLPERLAVQREFMIDPYFVDLVTAPRTLAAEVIYWRGVMKERAKGAKSFWHLDLAPTAEA